MIRHSWIGVEFSTGAEIKRIGQIRAFLTGEKGLKRFYLKYEPWGSGDIQFDYLNGRSQPAPRTSHQYNTASALVVCGTLLNEIEGGGNDNFSCEDICLHNIRGTRIRFV